MGVISKMIKTCFAIGAGITAYQASQKTKKETGSMTGETFSRNFMDQAKVNAKCVVDFLKEKLGKQSDGYRVSDKGENGYTYVGGEPAEDKVSKVFETMKEKAPEVIGKVQDFVEDVRENAPEYKEKAKVFVEDVKEAVKKAVDIEVEVKVTKDDEKARTDEAAGETRDGDQ
jgi:hypothetical protein